MRMPSVSQHAFSMVPRAEIPRSSFDRSHRHLTALDAGYLVPIFVDEALPGDTFNLSMTGFCRLATPIYPVMDNMYMETFFFAVPNRLIWDNWRRMLGEQDDPDDSTDYTVPYLANGTIAAPGVPMGSIYDYMGIPAEQAIPQFSALPFRAYNLIFKEWFRDQNLVDSPFITRGDGPDCTSGAEVADRYRLRRRGKRHDYFTSCLPWPQKGDSVTLPLGGTAPVIPDGSAGPTFDVGGSTRTLGSATGGTATTWSAAGSVDAQAHFVASGLMADLGTATGAAINAIRQAFQMQKYLERDARGGTRLTEKIKAHFGVTSPDARMQRPEYLGGGSSPVIVAQVPQTAPDATDGSVGRLGAYGTVQLHNHGFVKSFTEHCFIIGLVSVRADLTYQQGIERMFFRQTAPDFYWPAFSMLGEQAVLRREIYCNDQAVDNETVFGYQERYGEYRYKPSRVSSLMRSTVANTLDAWHLAQEFSTAPVLDETFIQDAPPVDRVIAVPAEPHFIGDFHFSMRCARPMPLFGVPGLIDHF